MTRRGCFARCPEQARSKALNHQGFIWLLHQERVVRAKSNSDVLSHQKAEHPDTKLSGDSLAGGGRQSHRVHPGACSVRSPLH
mmetsp:Transcript_88854/g.206779  ORF Transcript_88854/g.206779 Transcript_88854/m.206779 type:complete len:83 (+) Transcript_88854:818-1066(+)